MLNVVNVAAKLAGIGDHWNPRIVAQVNETLVKLVKFKGEFVWHHHDREDELFWVLHGTLRMRLRDGDVLIGPGEFMVVPRGVEHLPVADEEVHVALIEPATTLNTGNVRNERTRERLDSL
ncbi:MAG: cupin domain-containing protein [Phycisphaerae bacterium]